MRRYYIIWFLLMAFIMAGCGIFQKAARPILPELPGLGTKVTGVTVSPEDMPPLPPRPFGPGEKLTYTVKWSGISVGTATLEVQGFTRINGFITYHIASLAKSNSFFSAIYPVRDRADTFVEVEKFLPVRFEKQQREGKYARDDAIEFDRKNLTAVYYRYKDSNVEKKTITIPPDVQDALSCLYHFRTLNIEVGKSVFFPVNADGKSYELEVKVNKKEKMKLPGFGKLDLIQVEPLAKFEGLFVRKGRMWIWLTDDDKKIPVLMRSKIPVGSITAMLEKAEGVSVGVKK